MKDGEEIIGVLTNKNVLSRLAKQQVNLSDSVRRAVVRDIRHVSMDIPLNELNRILTRNDFVLVDKKYIVTTADLLEMMADPKHGHTKRTI